MKLLVILLEKNLIFTFFYMGMCTKDEGATVNTKVRYSPRGQRRRRRRLEPGHLGRTLGIRYPLAQSLLIGFFPSPRHTGKDAVSVIYSYSAYAILRTCLDHTLPQHADELHCGTPMLAYLVLLQVPAYTRRARCVYTASVAPCLLVLNTIWTDHINMT
ncbi:hypothetical protein LZ31DRAFT_141610 [Colletotrichum somersetense]|nr:hypothetical protein LZ31DRAFT_141610 [Colletotrichum somersetense]